MRLLLFCLNLVIFTSPLMAQETLGLTAPGTVVDSGLLKHILPRFSLKTGVRVVVDPAGAMQLAATPPGTPVFQGGGVTYYLRIDDAPRQHRFRDWLTSEIGKRTIEGFPTGGPALFNAQIEQTVVVEAPVFDGDAVLGASLSVSHCGRCHVVNDANRMKGLGSTPSFAVLRSLGNWQERFEQFYVLRPHGTFTQISGVTAPFADHLPPPIFPLRITLDELEAIVAFVAVTEPADLGAPLVAQ
ncbi:MAG: mono/diheme cytochrome c family protein [Paracoccaceae bacterium]|jgi:mono/diheme cytochrome c family protein